MVYQGHYSNGNTVINARVNPLILAVWVGFVIVALGAVCATVPPRGSAALRVVEDAKPQAKKA